jgi:hypothetical protein
MTMPKILPKALRGTVYVVAVVAFLVAAGLDGTDAGTIAAWVDNTAELTTAIGSALALVNLRDPGEAPRAD